MSKPIGQKKTGGRQAGTPNKKTSQLTALLNAQDLNLAERILNLLPELSKEKQVDTLIKLMPYIYPKRTPVSLQPADQVGPKTITVNFVDP